MRTNKILTYLIVYTFEREQNKARFDNVNFMYSVFYFIVTALCLANILHVYQIESFVIQYAQFDGRI